MPRHIEKKTLPYTCHQMFELVADIERYPDFLPWCCRATIIERKKNNVVADLVVGNRILSDSFRSHVTFDKPHSITVTYGGGALKHLSNVWRFDTSENGGCEISFFVDFEINSKIMSLLMEAFFDQAFKTMVSAFEKRAALLYKRIYAKDYNRK